MFKNRTAAGQMLAEELSAHVRKKDAIVLGIPRGGIVVAGEVARKLSLPLDMVVIKKIGIDSYCFSCQFIDGFIRT